MAGDWLKLNYDLWEHRCTQHIVHETGLDEDSVVGKLARVWKWAQQQTTNGTVKPCSARMINSIARHEKFAEAMQSAGWLDIGDGFVKFTRWDQHNSKGAKQRALDQRRARRLGTGVVPDHKRYKCGTEVVPDKTRQERDETKEEIQIHQNGTAFAQDLFSDDLVRSALRGVGVDGPKADAILTHPKATRQNVLNATAQMQTSLAKGRKFTHPDRMLMRIAWGEPGVKEKVATARARTSEQFAALRNRESAA